MLKSCHARSLLAVVAFLMLAAAPPIPAQTATPARELLTNALVIEMVTAKLPEDVILDKIRRTPSRFDVSARGLIALQRARVPAPVIRAMTEAADGVQSSAATVGGAEPARTSSAAGASRAVAAPTQSDPAASQSTDRSQSEAAESADGAPPPPSEPGIYMWHELDGRRQFTLLEPSVFSQAKSGGWLKTSLSYGIAKSKTKAVLRGQNASLYTTDPKVAFYFVFERTTAGLSGSSQAAGTSSPNEFVLLRLRVTKNSRETVIGSANAYGASSGVDEESVVPFTVSRLRPGVYRVTPNATLGLGEYAFTTGSTTAVFVPGLMAKDRVFDFGVAERR